MTGEDAAKLDIVDLGTQPYGKTLDMQMELCAKRQDDEILLLASSDMNHFLDAETTRQLDFKAISAMTAFDPQALYRTVHENRISMCGVLPAVVVMQAAKELGASECHLLRYAHSGQINDDNSRVVGYAALSMR